MCQAFLQAKFSALQIVVGILTQHTGFKTQAVRTNWSGLCLEDEHQEVSVWYGLVPARGRQTLNFLLCIPYWLPQVVVLGTLPVWNSSEGIFHGAISGMEDSDS